MNIIAICMFFVIYVLVGDPPGHHKEEVGNIAEEEESRDQEHSDGNMTPCIGEGRCCLRAVSKRSPQILHLYHHTDKDSQGYSDKVEESKRTSKDAGNKRVFMAS